jgi:hypothetical protein
VFRIPDEEEHVVKALRYKPESRGFESRGICSASNRNEYQKQENNVSGE